MSVSMLTWLSQPGLPVPPAYNPAHLFVAHLPRVLEVLPQLRTSHNVFATIAQPLGASVYTFPLPAIALEDIADEILNYKIGADALVDVPSVRTALQVVAANVGVAIAPRPLLKVLSKKQVVALGFSDSTIPLTEIALVWRKEDDCDEIQDFVGVAKGRTRNTSRNSAHKRGARDKAKAKQARRKSQGTSHSKPLSKRYRGSHQRKRC